MVVPHATWAAGRCAPLLTSIHIRACAPLSRPAQASDSSSREISVAPPANVLPIPKRRPSKSGTVASKRPHYARRVGDVVCTPRVYAPTYQINCPRSRRPRALQAGCCGARARETRCAAHLSARRRTVHRAGGRYRHAPTPCRHAATYRPASRGATSAAAAGSGAHDVLRSLIKIRKTNY